MADSGEGDAVRVLLLARSAGEWWDRLQLAEAAVRELLTGAYNGEDLAAPVTGDASETDLILAAIPQFAERLGVPVPEGVAVAPVAGVARILDLHAAALVAVLRLRDTPAGDGVVRVDVAEVLGELLAHEEQFWQGTAARAGLFDGTQGLTPELIRRIVAAGCLLGASDEDDAVALLDRVPGVTGSVRLASWLRDLYLRRAHP